MIYPKCLCCEKLDCSSEHARNPLIIDEYVQMGLQHAMKCTTADSTEAVHLQIIHNLENTMCDSLQSLEWRTRCFEQLKNLCPIICELMPSHAYERYWTRIEALHAYFVRPSHKHIASHCHVMSSRTNLKIRKTK
jgi:hypothetical protein